MRCILVMLLMISINGYGQLKSYIIGVKGDTLNRVDIADKRQGPWVERIESVRGEPGFEEEGEYKDGRKEGMWRKYTLQGDLLAIENFRWGNKDGMCQYFNIAGSVVREESWRAFNPDKLYDTLDVEDVNNPDHYVQVVVKNEGSSLKHGTWKYYDPGTGFVQKTEFYRLGQIEKGNEPSTLARDTMSVTKKVQKPKEVLEFEKKNSGKKKVRVRDGSVSY
ncbi:hypothetical protein KJS94_03570 [Flavihumibacter rivuli]|uniref:hypothetical protein n=1 Tax=Flavihumibacter rivuli TaxID=2838156 RepID=UPI001BDE6F23|nr:hypothetical protein [Flavihumibacter rivuli]ULQ57278.1 hypothetical protein KJS94_03570 [Flavihumibacter rivuli]